MNQQTYQDQLYAEHQRANQAEYDNLVTSIALCQQESENAQYEYQQAVARGDYSAMAEAQRRMSRAEGRLAQLRAAKKRSTATSLRAPTPPNRKRPSNISSVRRPRWN